MGIVGRSMAKHKPGWLPSDFDESWHLIIVKEFHYMNSKGENLENPFGIIWALKT
jgi:hypothetical protein